MPAIMSFIASRFAEVLTIRNLTPKKFIISIGCRMKNDIYAV